MGSKNEHPVIVTEADENENFLPQGEWKVWKEQVSGIHVCI